MKKKFVFKKNLLKVTILACIMAFAEECFFAYYNFNYVEEDRQFALVTVMCLIPIAVVGLCVILFKQYLIVDDETVTLCKLFKREKTINWKDATLTETTQNVNGAALQMVVITDGTQTISFLSISDKNLTLLKELCKTARERYNTDNLTF